MRPLIPSWTIRSGSTLSFAFSSAPLAAREISRIAKLMDQASTAACAELDFVSRRIASGSGT